MAPEGRRADTFNPAPLPIIPMAEVQGVLESRLGDSFHGTAAYWGPSGAVNVAPEPAQNAFHVDVTSRPTCPMLRTPTFTPGSTSW